ncbi:MAG: N-acetyl-gamma-glutamyl-phosphate reductase [Solirubrobacterales bacterium]
MADARVVVAGASGFAGALAAHLVHRHPRLELAAATARSDAGERLDRLYPRYRVPLELTKLDVDDPPEADAAIVAYPHGAAAPVVARLLEAGMAVVDVSADFRLHDVSAYEATYGDHGAPELLEDAIYGLTELHRDDVRDARLVANPGCYPTAALLALAPLTQEGIAGDIVISAASGVSGAGRGGGDRLHFVSVDENYSPYGVDGHRHLPEITQELGLLGGDGRVTFVPHLLPLDQGLLASCFVSPAREIGPTELDEAYRSSYADEPFVELVEAPPGVRDVRETNLCRVHVATDAGTGRVMAFAAIDNLWKGAAGQAIQNLNLMLGFDETEGLL